MRFWLWCFILLLSGPLVAQSIDTLQLDGVVIQALRHSEDRIQVQIDSTVLIQFPASTISEVLQQQSNIFIKTYGASSSATTSIRGGSASHTLVLWNGLPIQNTMLGQSDFSLLPSALFDEVELELGGNGAVWGSAAIGGAIHLNNQVQENNTIQLRSTLGSFGLRHHSLQSSFTKSNWTSAIKIWRQRAKNDFPYQLSGSAEQKRQIHADFEQWGVLQENQFKVNNKFTLNWNNWYQTTDREIPPTTTQNESVATQEDESFRTALSAKWLLNQTVWQARVGLFWEQLNFFDLGIDSRSTILTAISELEGKRFLKNHTFNWGINFTRLQAETGGYAFDALQNRLAFFVGYEWQWHNWNVNIALRQERVESDFVPFTPSLKIQYAPFEQLLISGNIARVFRLPTFNDLYWEIGGNPDLKPELGWNQELAVHWKQKSWSFSVTGFNRHLNNRILWQPLENSFNWSPQNVDQVWSRGVEVRLNGQLQLQKWNILWSNGYDYVHSTVQKAEDTVLLGKQLIYTPEHQFFSSINIRWQHWQLNYNHRITGRVLIQARNPKYLQGYQLGYLSAGYDWKLSSFSGNILFKVNNLWNTNYRIIDRRPMPLQHYEFSFLIKI